MRHQQNARAEDSGDGQEGPWEGLISAGQEDGCPADCLSVTASLKVAWVWGRQGPWAREGCSAPFSSR